MSQFALPLEFPFNDPLLPYRIELMRLSDINQVMSIERAAFPAPWPASAYRYELLQNDLSTYLILRSRRSSSDMNLPRIRHLWPRRHARPILGYGGFWLVLDEAHISTIAVHDDWRGQGLGELMLAAQIDAAILRGAVEITLEVRVSNSVAQNLYRKYTFTQVGRRKKYYHDNGEDALIMTTPRVDKAGFLKKHAQLKAQLRDKLIQDTV
jgi:ribosomal-protein-alanine N-acetyltransferase